METLHVPHWIARIVNYSHLGVVGGYHSDPATCDLAWGWAMRALPWFVRQLTVVESVDDLGMASPGGLVCIRRARPLSRRDMRRVTRAHARGVRVLVVFTFADNHLPRRRRSYIDPLPTLPVDALPAFVAPRPMEMTAPSDLWVARFDAFPKQVETFRATALSPLLELLRFEYEWTDRGFHCHRTSLFCGFRDGTLLGIRCFVDEWDPHLLDGSMAPCFCQLDEYGRIELLWTHPWFRGHGLAQRFLDFVYRGEGPASRDADVHRRTQPLVIREWLDSAEAFWQRRAFVTA